MAGFLSVPQGQHFLVVEPALGLAHLFLQSKTWAAGQQVCLEQAMILATQCLAFAAFGPLPACSQQFAVEAAAEAWLVQPFAHAFRQSL